MLFGKSILEGKVTLIEYSDFVLVWVYGQRRKPLIPRYAFGGKLGLLTSKTRRRVNALSVSRVPGAHLRSGVSLLIEKKKRPLNTAAAMHQTENQTSLISRNE
jgi:hypothetical protein